MAEVKRRYGDRLALIGNVNCAWVQAGTREQIERSARYCLKHELGLCTREGARTRHAEPLSLVDDEGRRLILRFDCARCEMQVYLAEAAPAS